MKIPTLRKNEFETWQYFQRLNDNELIAMLGSTPQVGLPVRTPNSLGISISYKITAKTVEKGKRILKRIIKNLKEDLCSNWESIKKYKPTLEAAEAVALIFIYVNNSSEISNALIHPIGIAELIARSCSYSLDKICSPS